MKLKRERWTSFAVPDRVGAEVDRCAEDVLKRSGYSSVLFAALIHAETVGASVKMRKQDGSFYFPFFSAGLTRMKSLSHL